VTDPDAHPRALRGFAHPPRVGAGRL